MPQPEVRVVGSGFTTLHWDGRPIAWLQSFSDTGQRTIESPVPIYELGDQPFPKEIVTPYRLGTGSITATIHELWNQNVWEHLQGLAGTFNLTDIYGVLRERRDQVTCQSIIRAPNGRTRGKVFHNCVITAIPDGDDVTIGGLSVSKSLTILYTHATPLGRTL